MASQVRLRASLRVRLIGLTVVVLTAIVTTLTVFWYVQESTALRDDHFARASTYGRLLSAQLRSAVAFHDRETAREVLGDLSRDGDISYVAVFDADGAELYERGTPRPYISRARRGVIAQRVIAIEKSVAVVAPVISLEGPRGTLVIELSMKRLIARQVAALWTAVAIGAVLLAFGVLAAALIARTVIRRLRAIGDVATAIAAGEIDREVEPGTRDEIGVLAVAFNQMLARLRADQRELDSRVEQRTAELQCEMLRRSQAELELRQAQKLESVGRLATGIAHEINTPIQFVGDSIEFIRDATGALAAVVGEQQATIAQLSGGELPADVVARAEAADLPFILEELPPALERTVDGLGRVASIVQSMKLFAHRSSELTEIDLNLAIASTLTIARNEYKYVADVHTEYGDLPPVTCYAGEINQVILNLLLNAVHAIADKVRDTEERGTITVRSVAAGDDVIIEIADTGCGIPAAVRDRIFDPFFTTKDVGRGTGQGLAIARAVVVDKHGGSLRFETAVGVGTTFRIRLPVRPAEMRSAA